MNKLLTILFSRIRKKPTNIEQWVQDRREACAPCPWNSKNMERLPWKKRILKNLSDFYSRIMGREDEDNLGNCTACDSCSIYYKILEKIETCPKNRWKK